MKSVKIGVFTLVFVFLGCTSTQKPNEERGLASYDLERQRKVEFGKDESGLHFLKFSNLYNDYMFGM